MGGGGAVGWPGTATGGTSVSVWWGRWCRAGPPSVGQACWSWTGCRGSDAPVAAADATLVAVAVPVPVPARDHDVTIRDGCGYCDCLGCDGYCGLGCYDWMYFLCGGGR